jgi:heme/copper-type cytochrome/quinol oxidase subunit 2
VKTDAVPGRLNEIGLHILGKGTFYGQCSELCGTNHGFMPIVIETLPIEEYLDLRKSSVVSTPVYAVEGSFLNYIKSIVSS